MLFVYHISPVPFPVCWQRVFWDWSILLSWCTSEFGSQGFMRNTSYHIINIAEGPQYWAVSVSKETSHKLLTQPLGKLTL